MKYMLRASSESASIAQKPRTDTRPGAGPKSSEPGYAAVDQECQYDDEQYSGYDPNNSYVIHVSFSFFLCLV